MLEVLVSLLGVDADLDLDVGAAVEVFVVFVVQVGCRSSVSPTVSSMSPESGVVISVRQSS